MDHVGSGRPQRPHRPHDLGPRIYRRRDGRWWYADLRPWPGGSKRVLRDPKAPGWPGRGEKTGHEAEARRWSWVYVEYLEDLDARRRQGLPRVDQRLGVAAETYLEHRATVAEPNTVRAEATPLRAHLVPFLGTQARAAEVSHQRVQELMHARLREGYAPNTLRTYLGAISRFAEWLGTPDLRRRVELPDPGRPDVRTWEPEELDQLREAAHELDRDQRTDSPSARLALEAALATGARRNELFALRWRDFNPGSNTVRIQWQLGDGSKRRKPLKGKRGRTAVVLPEWWEFYEGSSPRLVLPGRAEGPFTNPQHLINRLLENAGLNAPGIGWHSFRHTYARRFLEEGASLEQLQKSLGHAKIRTTEETYGHLREDVAARLAVEKIYPARGLRVVDGGA